ncbi:Hypothetical predicted protein, partial [Paramuricea clavata]
TTKVLSKVPSKIAQLPKKGKPAKTAVKRKRVGLDSDDKTRKAMSCVIAIMYQNDITAKEAVLSYRKEMEEEFPYDYVELIKEGDDKELDDIYKQMLNKNLLC